jgi:cell division protein ZapA
MSAPEGLVMGAKTPPGSERTLTLDVAILGREFKVACKESERAELADAVAFLDRRMREIRDGGKVSGTDRIALMAALNITHELLRERQDPTRRAGAGRGAVDGDAARRKIQSMNAALDQVLASQEKLL